MKKWITILFTCVCTSVHTQVNNKLSVYIFLSPECPLCQNYARTLNTLNKEFNEQVKFIGVIPGKTYNNTEINKYIADYKIRFDIINDTALRLVEKMKATVTPEAILVDQTQAILYRGAIDDWAISPGKKKLSPTIAYLKNAIEQTLSGNDVIINSTKPVGCLIDEF